jgi:hypothetical protein
VANRRTAGAAAACDTVPFPGGGATGLSIAGCLTVGPWPAMPVSCSVIGRVTTTKIGFDVDLSGWQMFKAIASSALKASSQRGYTRLINRGHRRSGSKSKIRKHRQLRGLEWDVLKASRSKEGSRLAGRDPSLRLAVLLVDLGSDRREVSGLSATKQFANQHGG